MATSVSYLRTLGRVPDHGSDQRKTVINHCPFVMFSCRYSTRARAILRSRNRSLKALNQTSGKKMSSRSITRALRIVPLWSMGKLKGEFPWRKSLIVKVLGKPDNKGNWSMIKLWKCGDQMGRLTSLTWATTTSSSNWLMGRKKSSYWRTLDDSKPLSHCSNLTQPHPDFRPSLAHE